MTERPLIHVECADCGFEFQAEDPYEAFDRQVEHDLDTGHLTVKRHVRWVGEGE